MGVLAAFDAASPAESASIYHIPMALGRLDLLVRFFYRGARLKRWR